MPLCHVEDIGLFSASTRQLEVLCFKAGDEEQLRSIPASPCSLFFVSASIWAMLPRLSQPGECLSFPGPCRTLDVDERSSSGVDAVALRMEWPSAISFSSICKRLGTDMLSKLVVLLCHNYTLARMFVLYE